MKPAKVSEAGTMRAAEPIHIRFFVPGNQGDPHGNPIPYHRMTQRSKWTRPAQRYLAYKGYVQKHALEAGLQFDRLEKNGWYRLDVEVNFADETHGDPENVRKGIQDAIFQRAGDKHVWGSVTFCHNPREVGVWIELRGAYTR